MNDSDEIDRASDYAICRAYDCGLGDFGRGRKLEASPYDDRNLAMHWRRGWLDAQTQCQAEVSEERKTNPRQPSIPDGD